MNVAKSAISLHPTSHGLKPKKQHLLRMERLNYQEFTIALLHNAHVLIIQFSCAFLHVDVNLTVIIKLNTISCFNRTCVSGVSFSSSGGNFGLLHANFPYTLQKL